MNRLKSCDQAALEAYIRGELDEAACEAVERHAQGCEACRQQLETAFAPEILKVRRAAEPEALPPTLAQRIEQTQGKTRGWRPALAFAGATAMLAVGWSLLWPAPKIIVTAVHGTCFVKGERLQVGRELAQGDTLAFAAGARIETNPAAMGPEGPWSIVTLGRQTWSPSPKFEARSGDITVETRDESGYAVNIRGRQYRPIGTVFNVRFGSTAPPVVSTFEGEVQGSTQSAKSGWQLVGERTEPILDDPTVGREARPRLPFGGPSGNKTVRTSADVEERLRLLSHDPNSAARWAEFAQFWADKDEWRSCAAALETLHSLDPTLASLSNATRLRLLFGLLGAEVGKELSMALARHTLPRSDESLIENWLFGSEDEKLLASDQIISRTTFDPYYRAHVALWAARARQNDEVGIRAAIEMFKRLLPDATAPRFRARVQYALGEAQFFLLESRDSSLDNQKAAVRDWPRADWLINVGVRTFEIRGNKPEAEQLILRGIAQSPSYPNYERVIAYLESMARGSNEHRAAQEFAQRVADEYDVVIDAQIRAATILIPTDPARARKYFNRALRIYGCSPSEMSDLHRNAYATLLRYEHGIGRPWTAEEVRRAVRESGIQGKSLVWFYIETGQFDWALEAQARLAPKDVEPMARARARMGTGQYELAAGDFEAVLSLPEAAIEPLDRADAWVRLAECQAQFAPAKSQLTVQEFLSAKIKGLDSGWRQFRNFDARFRARAHAVLGKYKEAARLQDIYLKAWPWNPDLDIEEQRRNKWQALAAGSLGGRKLSQKGR